MSGLPGVSDEVFEEGQCLLPEIHALHHEARQLEDTNAESVSAASRIALDQTPGLEVHEESVDRRLVEPDPGGQLGDTQLGLIDRKRVEQRHRPLDSLDPVMLTDPRRRGVGPVRVDLGGWLVAVSHVEHVSCDR